jgi:hypothetical protein
MLFGLIGHAQSDKTSGVLWVDYDFKNIPEPITRDIGFYAAFFNSEGTERWKRAFDVPRFVRLAAGTPKQAPNVNALDEVPDSSWFTNRHALRHMSLQQLTNGPNRGAPPDFSHGMITKAKMEGVTPGLQLTDNNGEEYLVKFDHKDYPELQSGAEVIATKILFAAGYNVPENYIAYLDPKNLEIDDGMEMGEGKSKRKLTREDLEKMLQKAARRPDGTYRVLASKILKGKPKGHFSWVGLRTDDPNDLIPHEHRRELRGLRVIASWINHWDVKEGNTLDMYVEENGRKFLRHFLIDFGSTLGGGKSPMEYFHGREYAFDTGNMVKEGFTLGLYVAPDEKKATLIDPAVGTFSATDFEPGNWTPSFHAMAFDKMTREDAFWATRIILSFNEQEIRRMVETAEYSDPKSTDHIVRTLMARRLLIARHWLDDVNPIGNFAAEVNGDGASLRFDNFIAAQDIAASVQYQYEVIGPNGKAKKADRKSVVKPQIPLGQLLPGETQVKIWTGRDTRPVTVHLQSNSGGGVGIVRIVRS